MEGRRRQKTSRSRQSSVSKDSARGSVVSSLTDDFSARSLEDPIPILSGGKLVVSNRRRSVSPPNSNRKGSKKKAGRKRGPIRKVANCSDLNAERLMEEALEEQQRTQPGKGLNSSRAEKTEKKPNLQSRPKQPILQDTQASLERRKQTIISQSPLQPGALRKKTPKVQTADSKSSLRGQGKSSENLQLQEDLKIPVDRPPEEVQAELKTDTQTILSRVEELTAPYSGLTTQADGKVVVSNDQTTLSLMGNIRAAMNMLLSSERSSRDKTEELLRVREWFRDLQLDRLIKDSQFYKEVTDEGEQGQLEAPITVRKKGQGLPVVVEDPSETEEVITIKAKAKEKSKESDDAIESELSNISNLVESGAEHAQSVAANLKKLFERQRTQFLQEIDKTRHLRPEFVEEMNQLGLHVTDNIVTLQGPELAQQLMKLLDQLKRDVKIAESRGIESQKKVLERERVLYTRAIEEFNYKIIELAAQLEQSEGKCRYMEQMLRGENMELQYELRKDANGHRKSSQLEKLTQDRYEKLTNQVADLTQRLKDKEFEFKQYRVNTEYYKEERESDILKAQNQITELSSKVKSICTEYDEKIEELKSEHLKDSIYLRDDKNKEAAKYSSTVSQLEQELSTVNEKHEGTVKIMKETHAKREKELEDQVEGLEKTVDSVTEDYEQQLKEQMARLIETETMKLELEEKNASLNHENAAQAKELMKLRKEIKELQEASEKVLQAEGDQRFEELVEESNRKISALQKEVKSLTKDVERRDRDILALEEKVDKHNLLEQEVKKELEAVQTKATGLTEELQRKTKEVTLLEHRIARRENKDKKDLEDLDQRKQGQQNVITLMQASKQKDDVIQSLTEQNEGLKHEIQALEAQLEKEQKANQVVQSLQLKVKEKEAELVMLAKKQKGQMMRALGDLRRAEKKRDDFEAQLENVQTEYENAEIKVHRAKADTANLRRALQEKDNELLEVQGILENIVEEGEFSDKHVETVAQLVEKLADNQEDIRQERLKRSMAKLEEDKARRAQRILRMITFKSRPTYTAHDPSLRWWTLERKEKFREMGSKALAARREKEKAEREELEKQLEDSSRPASAQNNYARRDSSVENIIAIKDNHIKSLKAQIAGLKRNEIKSLKHEVGRCQKINRDIEKELVYYRALVANIKDKTRRGSNINQSIFDVVQNEANKKIKEMHRDLAANINQFQHQRRKSSTLQISPEPSSHANIDVPSPIYEMEEANGKKKFLRQSSSSSSDLSSKSSNSSNSSNSLRIRYERQRSNSKKQRKKEAKLRKTGTHDSIDDSQISTARSQRSSSHKSSTVSKSKGGKRGRKKKYVPKAVEDLSEEEDSESSDIEEQPSQHRTSKLKEVKKLVERRESLNLSPDFVESEARKLEIKGELDKLYAKNEADLVRSINTRRDSQKSDKDQLKVSSKPKGSGRSEKTDGDSGSTKSSKSGKPPLNRSMDGSFLFDASSKGKSKKTKKNRSRQASIMKHKKDSMESEFENEIQNRDSEISVLHLKKKALEEKILKRRESQMVSLIKKGKDKSTVQKELKELAALEAMERAALDKELEKEKQEVDSLLSQKQMLEGKIKRLRDSRKASMAQKGMTQDAIQKELRKLYNIDSKERASFDAELEEWESEISKLQDKKQEMEKEIKERRESRTAILMKKGLDESAVKAELKAMEELEAAERASFEAEIKRQKDNFSYVQEERQKMETSIEDRRMLRRKSLEQKGLDPTTIQTEMEVLEMEANVERANFAVKVHKKIPKKKSQTDVPKHTKKGPASTKENVQRSVSKGTQGSGTNEDQERPDELEETEVSDEGEEKQVLKTQRSSLDDLIAQRKQSIEKTLNCVNTSDDARQQQLLLEMDRSRRASFMKHQQELEQNYQRQIEELESKLAKAKQPPPITSWDYTPGIDQARILELEGELKKEREQQAKKEKKMSLELKRLKKELVEDKKLLSQLENLKESKNGDNPDIPPDILQSMNEVSQQEMERIKAEKNKIENALQIERAKTAPDAEVLEKLNKDHQTQVEELKRQMSLAIMTLEDKVAIEAQARKEKEDKLSEIQVQLNERTAWREQLLEASKQAKIVNFFKQKSGKSSQSCRSRQSRRSNSKAFDQQTSYDMPDYSDTDTPTVKSESGEEGSITESTSSNGQVIRKDFTNVFERMETEDEESADDMADYLGDGTTEAELNEMIESYRVTTKDVGVQVKLTSGKQEPDERPMSRNEEKNAEGEDAQQNSPQADMMKYLEDILFTKDETGVNVVMNVTEILCKSKSDNSLRQKESPRTKHKTLMKKYKDDQVQIHGLADRYDLAVIGEAKSRIQRLLNIDRKNLSLLGKAEVLDFIIMTHDQMDISLRLAGILVYSDYMETAEYMEPEKTIDKSKLALLIQEKDILYDTLSVRSFDTQSLRFQVHKQWETVDQRIAKSATPPPELLVRRRVLHQQEQLLLEAIEKAGGWEGALYLDNHEPDLEIKLDVWPEKDQISMLQAIKDHLVVKLDHAKEQVFKAKKRARNLLGAEEQKMLMELKDKVEELHSLAAGKFRRFAGPKAAKILDSSMDEINASVRRRPTTGSSGRPDSRLSRLDEISRRQSQNSLYSEFSGFSADTEILNLIPADQVGPILNYFMKILGSLFNVMISVDEKIRNLDESTARSGDEESHGDSSSLLSKQAQQFKEIMEPLHKRLDPGSSTDNQANKGRPPKAPKTGSLNSDSSQKRSQDFKHSRSRGSNDSLSSTPSSAREKSMGLSEHENSLPGAASEPNETDIKDKDGPVVLNEQKSTQTDLMDEESLKLLGLVSQEKMNSIIGEMAGEIEKRDSEISRLREQEEEANQLKEIILELGNKKEELEIKLQTLDEEKKVLESEKAGLQMQKLNEGLKLRDIEYKLKNKPDLQSKHALMFLRKAKLDRINTINERLKKVALNKAEHFLKVAEAYKWAYHVPQVTFNGKSYSSILEFAQVMKYGYKKKVGNGQGNRGKRFGLQKRGTFVAKTVEQSGDMVVEPTAVYRSLAETAGFRESVSHPPNVSSRNSGFSIVQRPSVTQDTDQKTGFVVARRSSMTQDTGETMVSPIVVYKHDSDYNKPRFTPWGAHPQLKNAYVRSEDERPSKQLGAFEEDHIPITLPSINVHSKIRSCSETETITSQMSHMSHFSWSDTENAQSARKVAGRSLHGSMVKPQWKVKKSKVKGPGSHISGLNASGEKRLSSLSVSASESQISRSKKKLNYRDLYDNDETSIRKSLPANLQIGQDFHHAQMDQVFPGEHEYKRWKPRGLMERR